MSGRGMARSAMFGAAASALWMAGASLPARAADQPISGPFGGTSIGAIPEVTVEAPVAARSPSVQAGADFVATAGLKQYAMTNHQLGTVRGGFTTGNGVTFNFGFAQVTTVNGTVVEGLMVQNGTASAFEGTNIPTNSCSSSCASSASASAKYTVLNGVVISGSGGQPALSTNPSFTANTTLDPSKPITVTSTANNGGTTITTTLGQNGIVNSIQNISNNQLINQASALSISVTGLAQAIAAAQAVNSVMHTLIR